MGWSNVTRNQVKLALRIAAGDSSQDALIDQLLPQAEAAVESYCKRRFASASYTEFPKGGGEALALRNRPVAATGLAVYLDAGGFFGKGTGAFASDTLLAEGTDYVLDRDQSDGTSKSGLLYRLGGGAVGGPLAWPWAWDLPRGSLTARGNPKWPSARGSAKVTYTAGYAAADVPADLQAAVVGLACWLYRNQRYGAILDQEHLADYEYHLAQLLRQGPLELGTVRSLLAPYREVVL